MPAYARFDPPPPSVLEFDEGGSATPAARRFARWATVTILALAVPMLVLGDLPLPALPQFVTLQAVFLVSMQTITAHVLLAQYRHRRVRIYLVLACGFLLDSLLILWFLLTYPGALQAQGPLLGGSQSAIWTWHLWHLAYPIAVLLALGCRWADAPDAATVRRDTRRGIGVVAALALVVAALVTVWHDALPLLIVDDRPVKSAAFFVPGGAALALALLAWALAWRTYRQRRTLLHLWIAVGLVAFCIDVAASLAAASRYSALWYFGRLEAMIAGGILFVAMLRETNLLPLRLATANARLAEGNAEMAQLLREKDVLMQESQRQQAEIARLAFVYPVTELPNRRLLMDRLEQALAQRQRTDRPVALMFVDLDRFKALNDTHGHDVGDLALREVARRLVATVRHTDTVSRLGGDEFVVLLANVENEDVVRTVAAKVVAAFEPTVDIGGGALPLSISVGVVICDPGAPCDGAGLLRRADEVMYEAKRGGGSAYRLVHLRG